VRILKSTPIVEMYDSVYVSSAVESGLGISDKTKE
jgi:hypothetical protein